MTELSGTPKFCPKCGARIETPSILKRAIKSCPQCGTENPIGAKFCKKDGYQFSDTSTEAPRAPQTTPKKEISDTPPTVVPVETSVTVAPPAQAIPSEPEAARSPAYSTTAILPPKTPVKDEMARAKLSSTTEPARVDVIRRETKGYSKGLLIGIPGVLALVAAGMGGYTYWKENQAGQKVLAVDVTDSQAASVPSLPQGTRSDIAESASSSLPQQTAPPSSGDKAPKIDVENIQQELNQHLQRAGYGAINVSVNRDGSVNLDGTVATKKQKAEVVRLALSQYGVERVNEAGLQVVSTTKPLSTTPQYVVEAPLLPPSFPPGSPTSRPDPAKLEGDINRALRSGGIGGVTAQVGDDFSVTLKGSATSGSEKNRAFQITRQFRGVGVMKDRVFVVQ